MEKAKVYFTKKIDSESLIKIYEKLGVNLSGNVGVKVSTGEKGSKGYLKADLIGPLVDKLDGTIIECNTAYPGHRTNYQDHIKVAEEHGFTSFIDAIWNSEDEGAFLLQERIDRQEGRHITEYAEGIGLGTREYELINID